MQRVLGHFEHSQHAKHAKRTNEFRALQDRQIDDLQHGGQDRYQIHQAPKTHNIFDAIFGIVNIANIIEREKNNSNVFNRSKPKRHRGRYILNGFKSQSQTRGDDPKINHCHPKNECT